MKKKNNELDNEAEERYAERLEELSNESFESENELEAAIDNELNQMQRTYFEEPVRIDHKKRKKRKARDKKEKSNGLFVKIVKAGTNLVTGDFKGMAKNLAKAVIGTAMSGIGTVASASLDAIVPEEDREGEVMRRRRKGAKRVAKITHDGFKELANSLPDDLEDREAVYEASKDAMLKAMAPQVCLSKTFWNRSLQID